MKQLIQQKAINAKQGVKNGILFIPDISGFTELVQSADVLTGKQITFELISSLVHVNELNMEIAEIEGDAVLFYRYGAPPCMEELLYQFSRMTSAFNNKREELERLFSIPLPLSLKAIVHYGPMAEYEIAGFNKLYGEVVVEAHRLLKNSVESDAYLLLTDTLLKATGITGEELLDKGIQSNKLCEVYGSLRNICFTWFDFTTADELKQVA